MATYMFFEGKQLRAGRIGRFSCQRIAFARIWVKGKHKRRVEVFLGSEHFTIRGNVTGKDR